MPSALRNRAAVSEVEVETAAAPIAADPLYGVAMLKIAMEFKKPDPRALDDIISGVLTRMSLDETDFRRFLERNGGLLRTIAQRKHF